MRFVFLGPPGAGKGTQAKIFAQRHNLAHIATGDMLREAIRKKTPLGINVEGFIKRGELVPDELMIKMVQERLLEEDCKGGFVLDGFPRTKDQAIALDEFLGKIGTPLERVIYLVCSRQTATERISGRRVCKNCGRNFHIKYLPSRLNGVCDGCGGELFIRSDDTEDAVVERFFRYHQETSPLIGYYSEKGLVLEISAEGSPEEIAEDLERRVWHR
jgi:adenylate kinase